MPERWESRLRLLSRMEPPAGLLERAKGGPQYPTEGPPLRSRLLVGVVAFAVFGAAVGLAWIAFRPDEPSRTAVLAPSEIQRIRVDGPPQSIAVGDGAAWVEVAGTNLAGGDGPNMLWRIDVDTGEATPLRGTEGITHHVVGGGFLWAVCEEAFPECGGNWLLKLDGDSGRILARLRLPGFPRGAQAGLGAVWVPTGEGLVKVDPHRMAILRVFPEEYSQIDITGGFVWATTPGPNRLFRIDPETDALTRVDVPQDPCVLEASQEAVWMATCLSEPPFTKRQEIKDQEILTKLDADTGDVLIEVPTDASGEMRVVGESLWMAYFTNVEPPNIEVVGFDLTSGEPIGQEFAIRRRDDRFIGPTIGGPVRPNVAADDHSLWISEFYAGEVIRLGLPVQGSDAPPDTAPRQSPTPAPTPQPTSSPSPEDGAETCDFPSFQPTYLPWLKEGELIPEPDAFYDGDSATLYWQWPGSTTKYVRLARQSTTIGGSGPGEPVDRDVAGDPIGDLYEGETPGDQAIYWNTGGATCSEFVLELTTTEDLSRQESKEAIIKIARSFQPQTPPSPSE